eukprot:Unigene9553_Nuclearia_a/m.29188 Unigene9553_Nuclearia_a/g.29188  ORF Unigene9553_Nuclearia_a/g.29188 Unigene9553_Nuclearia_a/m.29188 type:complete len:385 (+) Unigene9553_Nuclearia_a:524-1678(+)
MLLDLGDVVRDVVDHVHVQVVRRALECLSKRLPRQERHARSVDPGKVGRRGHRLEVVLAGLGVDARAGELAVVDDNVVARHGLLHLDQGVRRHLVAQPAAAAVDHHAYLAQPVDAHLVGRTPVVDLVHHLNLAVVHADAGREEVGGGGVDGQIPDRRALLQQHAPHAGHAQTQRWEIAIRALANVVAAPHSLAGRLAAVVLLDAEPVLGAGTVKELVRRHEQCWVERHGASITTAAELALITLAGPAPLGELTRRDRGELDVKSGTALARPAVYTLCGPLDGVQLDLLDCWPAQTTLARLRSGRHGDVRQLVGLEPGQLVHALETALQVKLVASVGSRCRALEALVMAVAVADALDERDGRRGEEAEKALVDDTVAHRDALGRL